MAWMGLREYARHRGCALSAVQKAIATGRIVTEVVDGKTRIESEAADRAWQVNTDFGKQSLLNDAGPAGVTDDPEDPGDEPLPGGAPADGDTAAYRRSRAAREEIRRQREQLELDRELGRSVDRDEVARLRFTEFRMLRDRLVNVGSRIKDACAATSDPLEVEQLVEAEICQALQDFADDVLTRGVLQDADDESDDDELEDPPAD